MSIAKTEDSQAFEVPPFFSQDDFFQLLQNVPMLEVKIHHLEEMNALNETTGTQTNEKIEFSYWNMEETGPFLSGPPSWNSLGA